MRTLKEKPMKNGRILGMVVACVFMAGSTPVFADDTASSTAPAVAPQNGTIELASVNPVSLPNQQVAAQNPLHADPRWPKLKNCIDNTTTPAAFQGCLQLAFMDVAPTGQVLALLTH
jgi:hypothetical protein